MSGICGLLNLDGAPVPDLELRAMTAMLEQRGPDFTNRFLNSNLGLGHTLLATTPEAALERQPFEHPESGCAITADVRLDNRPELIGLLGTGDESAGDAELILRAYLVWGTQCVDRLLGDFSFAIWDPRNQLLFCIRDRFGMRPFYYHHAKSKRFVFGSSPKSILVLPQVDYEINQGRIADFLVSQLEWIDYTSTFFDGVSRLPPGHMALVTPDQMTIKEYWSPEPGPDPGQISDDDYREGFLEVFSRSVDARLRSPDGALGSMLSGGMDSGSVVVVARDLLAARQSGPLPTYSAVRRDPAGCAESSAIRASTGMTGIDPSFVHLESLHTFPEPLISGFEEPFDGQFIFLKAVYMAARAHGRRVMLDGAGGDMVLNEGSYIIRLCRRGHLRRAVSEIRGECRFYGGISLARQLMRYAWAAAIPETIKARIRESRRNGHVNRYVDESLISHEFARDVDIERRCRRLWRMFPAALVAEYATESVRSVLPNMTGGRERYSRIAAGSAMEARDPFLDKRVVEYCSRIPGHVRMRNGWPKVILRDIMSRRLPEEVLWCRGKPHLGWPFNKVASRQLRDDGNIGLADLQSALTGYVDPVKLDETWRGSRDAGGSWDLHTAIVLAIWLQENGLRPVVPQ